VRDARRLPTGIQVVRAINYQTIAQKSTNYQQTN
jgi:hypothetical protein